MPTCKKCGENFLNHTKHLDKIINLQRRSFCLICNIYISNKIKIFKEKCVAYKGGKCVGCGYNRCNNALEFHHTNPEEKDFEINEKRNSSIEKVKKELDKCILLCSNCHRELHTGILILDS